MEPGISSLNPYAASYIPLSKREACDRTGSTTKYANSANENLCYGNPRHVTQNQNQGKLSQDSIALGAQNLPILEVSNAKGHPFHGSYGSSSKQMVDEDFEMELEYLHMSFPSISNQSLTDVYLANNYDLEATVDMLTNLEFETVESSENLPDTLDIDDVSESGSSSECAAMKLKTAVDEAAAAASSSCSPGSAVIS